MAGGEGDVEDAMEVTPKTSPAEHRKRATLGGLFLSGVAGMSLLAGLGYTITQTKKKDHTMFTKGLVGGAAESGGSLAMRALGRGTLYAVSGFGLFCFGVWKLLGVHSMEEFTTKIKSAMPQVPKDEPQGRNDFKTVREVFDYIISEDEKKKLERKS